MKLKSCFGVRKGMTFNDFQEYVDTYEGRTAEWWEYCEYIMRYGTIPLTIEHSKVPWFHMVSLWWEWFGTKIHLYSVFIERDNCVYWRKSDGLIYSNGEQLRLYNRDHWEAALQMARAGMPLSEVKSFLEL